MAVVQHGQGGALSTEERLSGLGRRYGVLGRTAVGTGAALVAPWSLSRAGFVVTGMVAGLFVVWGAVYLRAMLRELRAWCVATDLAVVLALCLAQPWIAAPELLSRWGGWVVVIASFTVAALQLQLRPLHAWPACAAVCLGYFVGAAAAPGVAWPPILMMSGWIMVEGALTALLWRLVRSGGLRADRVVASSQAAERRSRLAAASRADQRAHWAALHDTAATTLLMIGLGDVADSDRWLHPQLRRDLRTLTEYTPNTEGHTELATSLNEAVATCRSTVDLYKDGAAWVPTAVAEAISGATTEALENTRRHAGTDAAAVRLDTAADRVMVTVTDHGRGFDASLVPPGRRGLRWSVTDRMTDVGGSARIESAPGAGTVVRLEWPDE